MGATAGPLSPPPAPRDIAIPIRALIARTRGLLGALDDVILGAPTMR